MAITIKRGDSRNIDVPFIDETGSPLDLTGATLRFTANTSKTPHDDTSAAITYGPITSFTDPTLGVATISLTPTLTNITPGTYYCDAQVKDASGNVYSSKTTKLVISGDITRTS